MSFAAVLAALALLPGRVDASFGMHRLVTDRLDPQLVNAWGLAASPTGPWWVANDYAPRAMYVTENGAAFGDVRVHDGAVHDPERTSYLDAYIGAVGRAIADGAPVKGYFVWSFLDNFEWGHGYSKRFGIVYVDYPTLERVPKDSFYWYRDHIAGRRDAPKPAPVVTG